MSKIVKVQAKIIRNKGGSYALMQSQPMDSTDSAAGVKASGEMIVFALPIQGVEGQAMSLSQAFAAMPGSEAAEEITLNALDGVICNPAGRALAQEVASGQIAFYCANAKLPELKGFRTRAQLLAQADREAGISDARAESDIIGALQARLAALENRPAA